MKRVVLITTLALLAAILSIVPAGGAQDKIDSRLEAELAVAGDRMVSAIVVMVDQADLRGTQRSERARQRMTVIGALQDEARGSQVSVLARLGLLKRRGKVAAFESYWIFNGFSLTATADVIGELAARSDVARIEPDAEIVMTQTETNIDLVGAPVLWNSTTPFTGQGVVVANLDSGVDATHPALSGSYRGGDNSWFDPYGQHSTPFDAVGHGTGTMGVIVGSGGIGMAPGAQWIAAKVFNDRGSSSSSAIHSALQWVLDPDGNPATDDAPDVVNSSWSLSIPGCYTDFQADLQALRASGIVPVFSAGNAGPNPNSSRSPANLPEALSVGATYDNDGIAWFSSRGPSACQGDDVFPDIVAPGFGVRTADLFGTYQVADGTSFSAPHVAGALALLLSAHPDLSDTDQEAALLAGAVDLGLAGPDTTYGWGRLDVPAAHFWLLNNPGGTTTTTTTAPPTTTTTTAPPTTTTTTAPPIQDQAPVAGFSVQKSGQTVTLDGGASYDPDGGSIVSYEWDFGDGTSGSSPTPLVTHTYAANGRYQISLIVTDDEDSTDSVTKRVRVRKRR